MEFALYSAFLSPHHNRSPRHKFKLVALWGGGGSFPCPILQVLTSGQSCRLGYTPLLIQAGLDTS